MASLLNNASLLLNPAGSIIAYEEDKIFSVLPSNGAGDFTFSGGDGGTRVNQQGYIEQTPANFMLNSGTTWSAYNVTIVTGIDDPVGGFGAYAISNIDPGYITDYAFKNGNTMPISAGTIITYSVYMRGTGTIATYLERGVSGTYWFNTKVHTLDPNEWKLFTHTYTVPTDASGVNTYVGNESGTTSTYVQVAFPSLNYGSTAKPYQPTTDRLNYPRITYQNGRGALLQEPQRTNSATYSEDLTNGVWDKTNVSITSNDIISPDGTQNADRVTRTNTSNTYFYNTNTGTVSNRANSIFLKKGTIDQATILGNSYSSGTFATFNLSNGTILSSAGCTPFIEQYKDGWYRCGIIQTNGINYILLVTLNGYNNDTVTNGEYLYAWGGQSEVVGTLYGDSKASSYIPTTSATVTRPLDRAYTGDTGNTSTSGVVYYDLIAVDPNSANGAYILIYNVSLNTSGVYLDSNSLGVVYNGDTIQVWNNSYSQLLDAFTPTLGQRVKLAIRYDGTNVVCFRDGIKKTVYSDTATGVKKYFVLKNGEQGYVNNNTLAYFPSALTDAQCQELTTVRSGSGGNISYYGPYTIHTFTGSATFTPSFTGPVEVLVVAGGGGGGSGFFKSACGGGGGAGGLQYVSSYGVSAGTGITVTVGAGGAGGPQGAQNQSGYGSNGSNSVFGGLTSIGGGGGTTYFDSNGLNGGSGGGAGGAGGYTPIGGQGTSGQGNNGGNQVGSGQSTDTTSCGGGGGAGGVGANGVTSQRGGNGGIGLPYSISGFSTYYAGGGGGGASLIGGGYGGLGGGGNGGNIDSDGSDAVEFTGGGGGGASSGPGNTSTGGGDGGDGIVIIRYLT